MRFELRIIFIIIIVMMLVAWLALGPAEPCPNRARLSVRSRPLRSTPVNFEEHPNR